MADPLDLITPVTSGMTFRDMRALAYSLADEVPDDAFPVTDVSRFLNQGIKLVAHTVPPVPAFVDITTEAGQPYYRLEDPLIEGADSKVGYVALNGQPLTTIDYKTIFNRNLQGRPSQYYVRGAAVAFYPVPDSVYTLSVEYLKDIPDYTDNDVPALSHAGRELAAVYAAYLMKLRDDEWNAADRLKDRFDSGLRDIRGPRPGVYKGV